MPEATVITITGHRPNKLGGYNPNAPLNIKVKEAIQAKMLSAIQKVGPEVTFNIGMALGVDQWSAELCIDLGVPFDAFLPCVNMEKKWPKAAQEHFRTLLKHARTVTLVHEGEYPGAWVMQKRNEVMVDNADYVLSVWDGTPGGTANCVNYAREKGIKTVNINPREL